MATVKSYDHDLQMFVDGPHEVDMHHATFQRWLVVHGRMNHIEQGPSSGPLADPPTEEDPRDP